MLGIHVAAVAGMALCGVLGRWQWGRAAVTHSAQNGFYAFEWWSFAIILAVVWVRTVQDELRPQDPEARTTPGPSTSTSAAAAAVDAEADDEMMAYNGYLAWLADNPRD